MSDTLRERIARALAAPWTRFDLEDLPESRRERYLHEADAVLEVLRNPSDEDVERAAKAEYENCTPCNWRKDLSDIERLDRCRDFRAGLASYLGGGE